MPAFRVLDSAKRPMQRLGYLKFLLARCVSLETSNLETLGHELVGVVTRTIRVPLTPARAEYIQRRLLDNTYRALKSQVTAWRNNGHPETIVPMEIQDVYLSAPAMPSRTGKLVAEDWRKYPTLGVHIGLIRWGTWSPLVRGVALLKLTPSEELAAFQDYRPAANPFVISRQQAMLLLYCLLENDGDVLKRLIPSLKACQGQAFNDRQAGDLLPDIFREIALYLRNRILPIEERNRLELLLKIAESIARQKNLPYSGGGAREEAIKVRLEPLVDMGLLTKDDPYKYEYRLNLAACDFFAALGENGDLGQFLDTGFLTTWARTFGPSSASPATTPDLLWALNRAWQELKSPIGYAPIVDTALLGGIYALTERKVVFEVATARQFLKDCQKEHPTLLRFGVDRTGAMAHVRILGDLTSTSANAASTGSVS